MTPDYNDDEPYAIITLYGWDGTNKIQPIKMLRSLTKMLYGNQLRLKEAKRIVDNLGARTEVFHLRVPKDAESFVKEGLKGCGFQTSMGKSTHVEDMLFIQNLPQVFGD